jgi:hypothetical protein
LAFWLSINSLKSTLWEKTAEVTLTLFTFSSFFSLLKLVQACTSKKKFLADDLDVSHLHPGLKVENEPRIPW